MNKSKEENTVKFVLFDAKGKILGRLATEIARVLSGKNEVDYEPRNGGSDWVVVINSDKVRLSGEKESKKIYWRHSGFPGGIYQATFQEMKEKNSTLIIEKAVKGMLPKNKLSKEAMKRLRIFKDEKHPYGDKISK
jgi:large subunit ribosomal protein L13